MALSKELREKYRPTIGIECHVQLKSNTKLFAAVGNDARFAEPNTLISHICVGMPGALPVLNEGALKLAAKAAFALGTKPQKFSHFDRKHYFYPDLPKGYQITQYQNPIILGGSVDITVDGQKKTINITRAHLEEDAGKNTHPAGASYSLVDLNRAGTPLLEIVSEPEIQSAAEAKAFARELYLLMKYADVSDVDLYHGNMRFDVNISVSAKDGEYGKRSEIKNLNSFRSVEAAVEYEIDRQIGLLEDGKEVVQETRGWDETAQKTTSQRGKEEAHDYRYFPDPDLPPLELSDQYIENIEKDFPKMPNQWRSELEHLDLNKTDVETLLEEQAAVDAPDYLGQILKAADKDESKFIANTIINTTIPHFRNLDGPFADINFFKLYDDVYHLYKDGKISSNSVQEIVKRYLSRSFSQSKRKTVEENAEEWGLVQVSDADFIEKIVSEVIAENPKAAEDVKSGEMKAIGFLVGQVMAKSKGQANPGLAQKIIKKQLGV